MLLHVDIRIFKGRGNICEGGNRERHKKIAIVRKDFGDLGAHSDPSLLLKNDPCVYEHHQIYD